MAKLDKLKEEIGWLRAVFTIIVVADISLLGWVAQNHTDTSLTLLIVCFTALIIATTTSAFVNSVAYKKYR